MYDRKILWISLSNYRIENNKTYLIETILDYKQLIPNTMKTKHLLPFLLLICSVLLQAQENTEVSAWKRSGKAGLNFSQSYLSNWAAGGQSAMNTLGVFGYTANFNKDKIKWDNGLDLNLGYSIIGDAKAIKTDDKIEFNSLYGLKASPTMHYSLSFSLRSQFTDGFNYSKDSTNPISRLFAPAYISLGAGIDWKPSEYFSITYSPLTGRVTLVLDEQLSKAGAYGVNAGDKSRFEFGSKAVIRLNLEIAENVNYTSKLELFSDYIKNPQNVDIDWQNQINMKVNSWLNANISAHLIYDDDIKIVDKDGKTGPRLQFKEVLSIGLSYSF